jgi:hypothetical protein
MATVWERTLPVPGVPLLEETAERDDGGEAEDRGALTALRRLEHEADAAAALAVRLPALPAQAQQEAAACLEGHRREMSLISQLEPACAPIVAYLDVALESAAERVVSRVAGIYARELQAAARRARLLGAFLTPGRSLDVG